MNRSFIVLFTAIVIALISLGSHSESEFDFATDYAKFTKKWISEQNQRSVCSKEPYIRFCTSSREGDYLFLKQREGINKYVMASLWFAQEYETQVEKAKADNLGKKEIEFIKYLAYKNYAQAFRKTGGRLSKNGTKPSSNTIANYGVGKYALEGIGQSGPTGAYYNEGQDHAHILLRSATEAGHIPAYYYYGLAYETGIGVTKSKTEAMRWYGRAVAGGDELAIRQLAELGKSTNTSAISTSIPSEKHIQMMSLEEACRGVGPLIDSADSLLLCLRVHGYKQYGDQNRTYLHINRYPDNVNCKTIITSISRHVLPRISYNSSHFIGFYPPNCLIISKVREILIGTPFEWGGCTKSNSNVTAYIEDCFSKQKEPEKFRTAMKKAVQQCADGLTPDAVTVMNSWMENAMLEARFRPVLDCKHFLQVAKENNLVEQSLVIADPEPGSEPSGSQLASAFSSWYASRFDCPARLSDTCTLAGSPKTPFDNNKLQIERSLDKLKVGDIKLSSGVFVLARVNSIEKVGCERRSSNAFLCTVKVRRDCWGSLGGSKEPNAWYVEQRIKQDICPIITNKTHFSLLYKWEGKILHTVGEEVL